MDLLNEIEVQAKLAEVMDRVVNDRVPVLVTRNGAEAIVMVSLADWNAIQESARLLSPPSNAKRLLDAIQQLDAAGLGAHSL